MLQDGPTGPVYLDGPSKIGPIDDEDQDRGQNGTRCRSQAQRDQPHPQALSHKEAKDLQTAGSQRLVEGQFRDSFPGQHQECQHDSTDGNQQAHHLKDSYNGEGLVKNLKDLLSQALITPNLKRGIGKAGFDLIDDLLRVTTLLKIKGETIDRTRSEDLTHDGKVHGRRSQLRCVIVVDSGNEKFQLSRSSIDLEKIPHIEFRLAGQRL